MLIQVYDSLKRINRPRIVDYYKRATGDWALIADIEYRLVNYHTRFAGKAKAPKETKSK